LKTIPLTQGQQALVDDEDYLLIGSYKWTALWNPRTRSYYAGRAVSVMVGGVSVRRLVLMHRQLLGMEFGDGRKGDHADGNTLRNVRNNLRDANSIQNSQNRRITSANTSGYKGACWDKSKGKWIACIRVNKRQITLGRFPTRELAHAAYQEAALKYHGEFARTA
jgi:hypothetical protein